MTDSSAKFLVFNSKTDPEGEDTGLIYCPSKDATVQWPKSVRRGRPRKCPKEYGQSLKYQVKESQGSSLERYEFVDCSGKHRPNDPSTRKFVRTHVMHNYQRKKQIAADAKPRPPDLETGSQVNNTAIFVELECPLVLSPERWTNDPFNIFPIRMQPYMHDLLSLYISAIAEHAYQIEAYWGFNPTKKLWVPLALTDPALLHSVLFCSDQFMARLNGQKERPSAVGHLRQAIRILNTRLQEPSQEISDSTIATVALLALTEQSSDNQENWGVHMRGIKRMVKMRGGLLAFQCNPILHDILCRADIWGSLNALSKPYLQMESRGVQAAVGRVCNGKGRILAPGFQSLHDDFGFEPDLYDILCQLHTVTQDINTPNPLKSEAVPLRLRESLRSIQYYLLCREEDNNISGSEDQLFKACRLGVLLYIGILQNEFWVPWISTQLIWQLKHCLQSEIFATSSMQAFRLWLLFLAGSIVLYPVEKLWFVHSIVCAISQLSISSWCETKLLLETFAWTGKVQDKSGRDLWEELMRMQSACDSRDICTRNELLCDTDS